ncbi:MAG TPA: TatD family hydrolase [Bacteroidota bacterium]|nr:TatD family hydrolase [Bacteroidota bacterium]
MFVDSHAHLFFKDYESDLGDVVKRAADAGVQFIVNPGTDLATSRESISLAEQFEMMYACVGFHPHDAAKADSVSLNEIERLSEHPKVVGIGEIGLDYHYDYSPREKQREIFALQIEIAQRRNLPIVIHSREAEADTLAIVEEKLRQQPSWRQGKRKGVFHCFPGDIAMAEKVIGWGFNISIPGPVTFPVKPQKPNSMADVVSRIPIQHIMLETDSPYLTPVPNRGKRNEPSNIPLIARKISELSGRSIEEVGVATTNASCNLFGINIH